MYKVVFDNGKPYEETYKDEKELEAGIRKFYEENKDSDYQFDFTAYNDKDEDISESQLIQELVSEILTGE